ncbi:MAG TPA: SGNH/GDSL hydrolase family protein [Nocardioides sp.]
MKILLTGDSITAALRDPGDPSDLGDGYVARVADALPGHKVLNTGINGHKVPDLQERWERDVLAHRPDLLSVMIGINDTWHAHFGGLGRRLVNGLARLSGGGTAGTTHEAYEAGYREILDRTRAAGINRLVLLEPFLVPVDDGQVRMLADLEEKMRIVRLLADEYDALFVPLHDAFTTAAQERDPAELVIDGVHPAPAGHDLIAEQWLSVVGVEDLHE